MTGQTVFKNTRVYFVYITENHGYVPYTVFFRVCALYLFVFATRPWLVKCTTKIWLRTRNKLANIHYFDGFGRPRVYSE